jgi:3-methyladenine DNA glycosylase AlkD
MQAYMKNVAPYVGIATPMRRAAIRPFFKTWKSPTADELAAVGRALWRCAEREFHYVACDFLARYNTCAGPEFITEHAEFLLVTKSWWDTVDSLGSAIVTPLVVRNATLNEVMWSWLRSDNLWLTRAALQHQRGLKDATDVRLLMAMCDERSGDREFFIAKAVGWALRDLAHIDPGAALRFLNDHNDLAPVARREAVRGLVAVSALPPGAR